MEIIDKLKCHQLWLEFMEYKISRGDLRKKDCEDLRKFVSNKEYFSHVCELEKKYDMPLPCIIEINKNGVKRKRQVFSFDREYNYILKMIAYLLKEYDFLFLPNLYSFRSNTGVKRAVGSIVRNINIKETYTYKVDISDYFNSINTGEILELIKKYLPEENWLYRFFSSMLKNPYAIKNDVKIMIKKGVMAGTPTAGFLANLYLGDLDEFFWKNKIFYARYSDDIIIFAHTLEEINKYEDIIKTHLCKKGLKVNSGKELKTMPGEKIEFLGFEFWENKINISDMSEKKLKAKIKRKSRALYRWKIKKDTDDGRATRAFIRFLNNKFYNNAIKGEITWCRWYFPLISDDDKLRRIDEYAIQNIRFIYTGRYGKKNYELEYAKIKEMGYKSLVNNYWKYKKGKYEM